VTAQGQPAKHFMRKKTEHTCNTRLHTEHTDPITSKPCLIHAQVHVNINSIDHILLLDSPEDHPGTQKVKVTTPQSPPPSAPAPPPPMSVASGMCVCTWVHVCVCVCEQKGMTHYSLLLLLQPHRHLYCNCCRRYLSCRTCQ